MVTLDSSRITKDSATRFHIAKTYFGDSVASANAMMNKFRLKNSNEGYNVSGTFFLDTNNLQMNTYKAFDTRADFVSEYGDLQICFGLITPITYQLTPTEIISLLGTNNLWADTGDSTVKYRADPSLKKKKKIEEAVSALL